MHQNTQAFTLALNARTDYEKAVIVGSEEDLRQALIDAEALGHSSYRIGSHLPPVLLKSVPDLKNAWVLGWESATYGAEIARCSLCANSLGDPCPIHD